eukprot:3187600-Rhodomonas_salina.1
MNSSPRLREPLSTTVNLDATLTPPQEEEPGAEEQRTGEQRAAERTLRRAGEPSSRSRGLSTKDLELSMGEPGSE